MNGTLPGPPLRFAEGDHVFVNVINNAQHNVTIHSVCPYFRMQLTVGMVCLNEPRRSPTGHPNLNSPSRRPSVGKAYSYLRYNLHNDTALPPEAFETAEFSNPDIPKTANSTFGWINIQLEPLVNDLYPTQVDQRISSVFEAHFRNCLERMAGKRYVYRSCN